MVGNVLTNDLSDPDDALVVGDGNGNPITAATTLTTDQGGTIVINPDGTYTYTPPADFIGEDSVTIEVCDSFGACVDSTLTIDIIDSTDNDSIASPGNTPPVAANDNFSVFSDPASPATLSSDLAGNDGDPEGDVIEVLSAGGVASGTPFTTVNGGTVVVNPDGTFDYTPAVSYTHLTLPTKA